MDLDGVRSVDLIKSIPRFMLGDGTIMGYALDGAAGI